MSPQWCTVRGCWVVRHPQRPADVIGTGTTPGEALAGAEQALDRDLVERW